MLSDIQKWWVSEHDYVCSIGKASKDPMSSLFALYERYSALTCPEKKEVDKLLVQWIDKADVGNVNSDELYTALACVSEFEIVAAIPAMEHLCVRLENCKIPEAPQEYNKREIVLRKLEKLKSIRPR